MTHTLQELKIRQALPLEVKINMTKIRLREWVNYYGLDGVYISFSGGKDSTVLLHIARSIYPDIKACFVDTGLEYPEIRFIKGRLHFNNSKAGAPFPSMLVIYRAGGLKE